MKGSPGRAGGTSTTATWPERKAALAAASSSGRTCTPPEASASRACTVTPGNAPTTTGSGPFTRKAIPSATERSTGNPKVQNSAPGSRIISRKRIRVSCTTGCGRCGSVIAQSPPGKRNEHVFQRGLACPQAQQVLPALLQQRAQRGHRALGLDRGQGPHALA